ncbi:MAG TPA: hypothetical protein VHD90_16225 [Phototrophicaceae bacterium]|nr:hypothetical protein [Phototrophicaceae bacterium]
MRLIRILAALGLRAVGLTAVFTLLIGAARLIGTTEPPPAALTALHLDECQLPCWLGITPDKTTLDDAVQRVSRSHPDASAISQLGNTVGASYRVGGAKVNVVIFANDKGIVYQLTLIASESAGLTMGDLVSYFGVPQCVSAHPSGLMYSSADAYASVIANSSGDEKWRQAVTNINITGPDLLNRVARCTS